MSDITVVCKKNELF